MLTGLLDWISFRTWFELSCLATGLVVISPLPFSRGYRKRLSNISAEDLEAIGFVVLIAALIGIGLYNRFGGGAGS